jgi:hypothetical protein
MSYDVCFGMIHPLRAFGFHKGSQKDRALGPLSALHVGDTTNISKRVVTVPFRGISHSEPDAQNFRMTQHNFNSTEYLELLYDLRLFSHHLFPAFLILAPNPGYRTRVKFGSVRIEKGMEAQPRGGVVSISLYDLGCVHPCVSRRWVGDGWGGWQTPRPSNEEVAKYSFDKIHRWQ